ncbi:hypothetical protein [Streptomyces sp. NPDC014995]|uniref:hypothetical protein n=1 Tax=Streptomyces sp. NPDC014995 TaxID=3364936 RepID=UPI0036FD1DC9
MMGDLPLPLLPTLPADEKVLRKRLFALVDKDHNGPKWTLDRIGVQSAVLLATTLPSTPALRAAAYRLLAAEPGVRSLGNVKDHTGRTGYAVALPSPYGSAPEVRLNFDKSTGMPLGTETVAPHLTIAAAAADHPNVARLVRALDDDLAARCPDEPCTGGSRIDPAIRFLLAEADGRPIGCCAVQPFPSPTPPPNSSGCT